MSATNELPQIFYLRPQTTAVDGKKSDTKGTPPIACVALLQDDDGNVFRGISICSEVDNWRRKVGRGKAIQRCFAARKAFLTHDTAFNPQPIAHPVNEGANEVVRSAGVGFLGIWRDRFGGDALPTYKASANPPLTAFEQKLLEVARERKAQKAAAPAPDPAGNV